MTTTEEPGPHGVPHEVRRMVAATMMESVTADVAIVEDRPSEVGPENVRIALRGMFTLFGPGGAQVGPRQGGAQVWSVSVETADTLLAALPEAIATAREERDRLS